MTATTEPPRVEDLLTQAPWTRRLAYRLVFEAEAPDLLQEAWIVATNSERPSHVPWSAWFGGAVRILGLRHLRDRARRHARERQAGAEALSSATDLSPEALLERAQLQRQLSGLVLGLAEPYRSTVLLRYEEGLSAAEIARRLEIPPGTVRWRLKQALDQLRVRLEEHTERDRDRGKRSWALLLAPLAGPRRRSPIVTWAPVLAVSATAIVAGLFVFQARQEHSALPAPEAPVASSAVPRGPTPDPNKEPDMNRTKPIVTLAMILGLVAHADAGNRAPLPTSKVARFQVPLGGAPIKGSPSAKVTILEFTDYECPFCANGARTMEALLAAYPDDVRYQVINFPLSFHKKAPLAARATLAAAQQSKYWEMHDRLFAHTDQLERADLERHARELGLDLARFGADLDGSTVDRLMEIDEATTSSVRITATPTYFINGRMISGARPLQEFKARVAEEIAFATQMLAAGVPPEQLYNEITSRGAAEIPETATSSSAAAVAIAIKKCDADKKILATIKGATILAGGAFTTPKGITFNAKQREVLGCLTKEIADKGFSLKL